MVYKPFASTVSLPSSGTCRRARAWRAGRAVSWWRPCAPAPPGPARRAPPAASSPPGSVAGRSPRSTWSRLKQYSELCTAREQGGRISVSEQRKQTVQSKSYVSEEWAGDCTVNVEVICYLDWQMIMYQISQNHKLKFKLITKSSRNQFWPFFIQCNFLLKNL